MTFFLIKGQHYIKMLTYSLRSYEVNFIHFILYVSNLYGQLH